MLGPNADQTTVFNVCFSRFPVGTLLTSSGDLARDTARTQKHSDQVREATASLRALVCCEDLFCFGPNSVGRPCDNKSDNIRRHPGQSTPFRLLGSPL